MTGVPTTTTAAAAGAATASAASALGVFPQPANFAKNLVYGGTAGLIGAACMFPVDTAKTRFQSEQVATGQQRQYRSIFDALVKIGSTQGMRGLYRGLQIQAIGIIPEKALKLSVNDSMRYTLRAPDGSITLLNEALAGGIAGFSQVIVTSPMEMLKIQLQLQVLLPREQQKSVARVVGDVVRGGLSTIYRGVGATLLRDVPFSIVYFPLFSNLKVWLASQPSSGLVSYLHRAGSSRFDRNVNNRVNLLGSFSCGLVAGSVAAWAVTPADVIKTRLQAEGGKEKWGGIISCARMTLQNEGIAAFFKGATARVILVGPLFGIVLATYEIMPRFVKL
eukprot:Unigene7844_Nuclearia_a/m.24081 Unigene7844_Nuclearia_a/g.24081  ORF Unigene7844_Nuclearia_a/g.24081 Unigene7844_Nuclearia_a/m.24081 type:complete len:335 (-) Unigene7844_Nuclearia_a:1133-2137(-)